MANPTRRELVGLWRFHTGERSPDVVTDRDIWGHLQAGLEAYNEIVRYYETDDTSLTLVAETQELDLPADCIEVRWVRWNGRFLDKIDEETLRNREQDFVAGSSGEPRQYYLRARKIGFVPIPSAAAVAAAATPTIRQVATPTDIAINATVSQLATQHRRIPVYFAVAEWFAGLGADPERSKSFLSLFSQRAEAARSAYEGRRQQR